MIRGLYSAASAMLATARAQEVITNNIANVNTPGFKRNIPVYQSLRGPLIIPAKDIAELRFNQNGEIQIEEEVLDQIRIEILPDPSSLGKIGKNTFQLSPEVQTTRATAVRIKQKYLETSNVDIISEMVNLIDNLRIYEASQKMIQLQDNTLNKLCNEIGMIR